MNKVSLELHYVKREWHVIWFGLRYHLISNYRCCFQTAVLALIVAASLTIAMTVGTLVGSMIPLLMNKINIDPAVASGPFITTINDIVSMLIYFGLATSFMSYLT